MPKTIKAGKKKREPHKSEVRALGAAACRLKSVDKKDARYKARAQKTAHPTKMRCASWERQLAAGGADIFKDEHSAEVYVSPLNAVSISSSGMFSILSGFLLALMIKVK